MNAPSFINLVTATQIITESIPVSSSTQVFLITMLALGSGQSGELPLYFDELLHAPMLLIIMLFFRRDWWPLFTQLCKRLVRVVQEKRARWSTQQLLKLVMNIVVGVFVATIATVVLYVLVQHVLRHQAWFNHLGTRIVGQLCTMLILLSVSRLSGSYPMSIGIGRWLALGGIQGLALLPGCSRFALTYVGSRVVGMSARRAFQVSFLLEMPIIVVASLRWPRAVTALNAGGFLTIEWLMLVAVCSGISYGLLALMQRLALREQLSRVSWYLLMPLIILVYSLFKG